jgi:hypothetical protein
VISVFDALVFRLFETAERIRREERGDTLVNWVVMAIGLAAAAAALVALLGLRFRTEGRRSSTSSPASDVARVPRRLAGERGDALIEGLFALALVLLVVAVGAQALAYAHARSVATAAAQDGARAAAAGGMGAGVARANAILVAAGGAGQSLRATAREDGDEVTVSVEGEAPRLFSLPLLLPAVRASASLPLERYPAAEAAP